MPLLLKLIILTCILISASSEERDFEAEVFAVTDLKVGDDDHEIDIDDLQSDGHIKSYVKERTLIGGHRLIPFQLILWYSSRKMRKLDDDEVISQHYKRRPDGPGRRSKYNRKRKNRKKIRGNCGVCGKMIGGLRGKPINKLVINGSVVQPVYKYPWIVSLNRSVTGIHCGGAIISATFIMTAGHCLLNLQKEKLPQCHRSRGVLSQICYLFPNEITVSLLGRRQEDNQRLVKVAQVIPHDEFDAAKLLHDIGLIRLANPIQCNELSLPICLPTTDLEKMDEELIVAGWGYNTGEGSNGSSLLREGTMKQIEPEVCQKANWGFYNNLTDIVCTIGTDSKQSSCMGDSGSSIFEAFGIAFYTIGVTSRHSTEDCQVDTPAIYAKVFSYIDWIKGHVKDLPAS